MATQYVSKALSTSVYRYENRATVYISPLVQQSKNIMNGPPIEIAASGTRCDVDRLFGSLT